MTITVHSRQTYYDVSIRYFGTTDRAVFIALLNGDSVTSQLSAGRTLEIPKPEDNQVTRNYIAENIMIGTGDAIVLDDDGNRIDEITGELIDLQTGFDFFRWEDDVIPVKFE